MAKRTWYDVLGLPRDTDSAAIEQAYAELIAKYQARKQAGGPDEASHITMLKEAYVVLSDATKRKAYDAKLVAPPFAVARS